jgi:hypothetical protein
MGKQKELSTLKSKTSSRKVKNPAAKGKAFEREIATQLGHIFPDAERNLEYQQSNCIGVDLSNTDVFRFQCKRYANYAPIGKIFEIRETAKHIPVLVTKGNKMDAMAVLPFDELVTLLEIAYGHRERLINPYMEAARARVQICNDSLLELGRQLSIQQKHEGIVEVFPSAIISIDDLV